MRLATLGMAALVVATGCATTTASKTQSFSVTSEPAGAQVRLNGEPMGVTPTRIEIPRKLTPANIEISLTGYQTQMCNPQKRAGGGYIAPDVVMCVLLFPIGCVAFVDADGSWNELESGGCTVTLPPLSQPLPSESVSSR